jgi:hypothetical protein
MTIKLKIGQGKAIEHTRSKITTERVITCVGKPFAERFGLAHILDHIS